jgi:hypothetical protein
VLDALMFLEKLRTLFRLPRPQPAGGRELRPVINEIAVAWPFTDAAVDLSPASPGVYLLYQDGRLIYIGLAVNGSDIRQELESHRCGARGPGTCDATAFLYEPAPDPRALHERYLSAHREHYGGRLPPGNEGELAAR